MPAPSITQCQAPLGHWPHLLPSAGRYGRRSAVYGAGELLIVPPGLSYLCRCCSHPVACQRVPLPELQHTAALASVQWRPIATHLLSHTPPQGQCRGCFQPARLGAAFSASRAADTGVLAWPAPWNVQARFVPRNGRAAGVRLECTGPLSASVLRVGSSACGASRVGPSSAVSTEDETGPRTIKGLEHRSRFSFLCFS